MREQTLYLVCGLPGAGKTTRAREVVASTNAVHLCPDEWVLGLGMSLVDYEFRIKLQACMLDHAGKLLRAGVSVIVEFGSWAREEREAIRQVAQRAGASTELHFVNASVDELVRRVRERGGPDAELLASKVLLQESHGFEHPGEDEIATFDRYFGPADAWEAR
jgi:predicted kinase